MEQLWLRNTANSGKYHSVTLMETVSLADNWLLQRLLATRRATQ